MRHLLLIPVAFLIVFALPFAIVGIISYAVLVVGVLPTIGQILDRRDELAERRREARTEGR